MKIVKLATVQTVSVAEFEDMRETWEYLFDAFDQRLDTLLEVWRQQRLDTSTQVECYAGGLFKRWHEKVCRFSTFPFAEPYLLGINVEPSRRR